MTRRIRVVMATVLGTFLAVAMMLGASRLMANTLSSHNVPPYVNYQGYLTDSGGNPISSTVTLVFRIWDASSGGNEVWNETHNNVPVNRGYFSVFLGSQGSDLTPSVFSSPSRYLEVTYNSTTFERQRFASVPYALVAQEAAHASEAISSTYATTATYALNAPSSSSGGPEWSHVKVVAKSGGDYTTINDALAAISPSSTDRYLILVMPGVYEERVELPEYVHLKGVGTGVTYVSSLANTNNFNDNTAATMLVPANAQVSDLTVRNLSTTQDAVGLKITTGNDQTILTNVRIETTGAGGDQHIGLYLNSGSPKLRHVHVSVSGGANNNWGIFNSASSPTLQDSVVDATGNGTEGFRYNGGTPVIMDSVISAAANGVATTAAGQKIFIERSTIIGGSNSVFNNQNVDIYIGASKLDGQVLVNDNNRLYCAQNYDENYVELNQDCQ